MEFSFCFIGIWLILPYGVTSINQENLVSNLIKNPFGVDITINIGNREASAFGCPARVRCNRRAIYSEFDGKCNNRRNPLQGSAGIRFLRFIPAEYDYDLTLCGKKRKALPEPRKIVSALNSLPVQNNSKITVLAMQFGQFISHDINRTPFVPDITCCVNCSENPLESNNCSAIDVKDDPFYKQFGIQCLEARRSAPASPLCGHGREQVNVVTAYIDGSVIYGSSKQEADTLRTFSKGQMKVKEIGNTEEDLQGGSCPATSVCPFRFLPTVTTNGQERVLAGDTRAAQHPALTAFHAAAIRVHNDLAEQISKKHPDYTDEISFQEARRMFIAILQHITYNEFLPCILPSRALIENDLLPLPPGSRHFTGYDRRADASLRNAFSAAAYRLGHSLVVDTFHLSNGNRVELSETFFNHLFTFNYGTYPSNYLNGMYTQMSSTLDQNLVPALSNMLFARGPNFKNGSDLFSLNIMRGRDHGLPPYAKFRRYCNLPRIRKFRDLKEVMRDGVAEEFEKLYKSVDDIDLYPAAISEKPETDGLVGPTLTCLLSEQFKNLKFGDRFYYENRIHPNRFSHEELNALRRTTLAAFLCRCTNTKQVPEFVMKVLGPGNHMKNCSDVLAGTVFEKFYSSV
ncbi:UNVERIFIED_CONTAM: hypothetical protein RMT77_016372 [Armadillidium vulgare]